MINKNVMKRMQAYYMANHMGAYFNKIICCIH